MENVTVSRKVFVKLLNCSSEQETWECLCENEKNINPEMDLRLAGGLDHINQTKTKIEFIDRGNSNGSNVRDWSFSVRPRDIEKKKDIQYAVQLFLSKNDLQWEEYKKNWEHAQVVFFAWEYYKDGGYEYIGEWTDFIFDNYEEIREMYFEAEKQYQN